MGGEGAMMAMINSLKNNSRRHKRTQFDKNSAGGYGDLEKVEFDCPEATPKVLAEIKIKLKRERKRKFITRLLILGVLMSLVVTLVIIS